jgi:hypothetical protein
MGNYASRYGDPALTPLWASIVGKPTTFAPSYHGDSAHSVTYVKATGTPVNNQIGVWTDGSTMEGDANLTWSGTVFSIGGKVQIGTGSDDMLIRGSTIENTVTNADNGAVSINFYGYAEGTTKFRDIDIYDGKNVMISKFDGSLQDFKCKGDIIAYGL